MRNILISLLLCFPLNGGELSWPRFRGNNGSGLSETKLPTKLSAETLVWSAKLPGSGSSSPVVFENKLFLTSENRDQKTISLVCLDAHSGKSLWTRPLKVGAYHLHRFNNTAASTPALAKDRVVIAWFDGDKKKAMMTAFDHGGKKIWDFDLGPFESQHGFCLNPVIRENAVITASLHMGEGSVSSISVENGKLQWSKSFAGGGKKTSYITPCFLECADRTEVVLASHSHGVWAHDLKTGKKTWALPKAMNHRTIVSPFHLTGESDSKPLIGVGCKNGTYIAVRPATKPGDEPSIAWKMKGKTPYVPTPVSDGRTVYSLSDGGALIAMDSRSGKQVWKKELRANFYASPLIAGNHFYALSREGELIVANLDKGFNEISRNSLNPAPGVTQTDATPAIAHNRLYLRVGNRIDCHANP